MIKEDKNTIWIILTFIMFVGIFLIYTNDNPQKQSIETQSYVDVVKYTGLWYSIYEMPNNFQQDCECVTAEYELIDNDTISVVNTCGNNGDGIEGTADIINYDTNAELEVDFGFFRTGDYNIIYVDDDYQYAIVGSKDRKYLWFLSREKIIPEMKLNEMQQIAINQSYITTDMRIVKQNCG
jgi:apolipoprotein D and lipocalin family protein